MNNGGPPGDLMSLWPGRRYGQSRDKEFYRAWIPRRRPRRERCAGGARWRRPGRLAGPCV